jgi:predicted nucleic acid-binding protein
MNGRREFIYWDTCIWLAWIGNENRKPGEMEGIQEDVRRFDAREITIVTSALTWAEMFKAEEAFGVRAKQRLTRFFNRPDVVKVAADLPVTRLAAEIRAFYQAQQLKDGLPTIALGDAIHLSSAILYRVRAFHTFDENDSAKPSKPKRGLLGLSGNVAGRALVIRKPPTPVQPSLRLVMPVERQSDAPPPASAKPRE